MKVTIINPLRWGYGLIIVGLSGCGAPELKPVDIYPEDMCSHCRMAISDQAFASEILSEQQDVYKFDDLGCSEQFKEKSSDIKIAAVFVKDYDSKGWLPYERAFIVKTSIKTPMGSGKVAFADSMKASEFSVQHPVNTQQELRFLTGPDPDRNRSSHGGQP